MAAGASLTVVYDALHRGDWPRARVHCQDLLAEDPDCAPAHHALGLSLCAEAAYEGALPHLDRAHRLDRRNPRWARDLGLVQARLAQWAHALAVLSPVLPDLDTPARVLYLTAAVEAGDPAAALDQVEPLGLPGVEDDPHLLCEYARALLAGGLTTRAEQALLSCLARHPAMARVHEMLGLLYEGTNRGDRAFDHWTAYARARPDAGYARLRLAMACSTRGLADDSREARVEALRLGLTTWEQHSTALYLMLFDDREGAASVRAAYAQAFEQMSITQAATTPAPPTLTMQARGAAVKAGVASVATSSGGPRERRGRRRREGRRARDGRLRIGYLSGEFRTSPAFYFLTPFLAHHDRSVVDLFLYHNSRTHNAITDAYRQLAEHWRDVSRESDDEVLAAVARDNLDVLVDLSGHFPEHRLSVFARRAAATQVTFPNYPATTGCPEMDYFFTDRWTSPAGSEAGYTERLHHLPSGYLVYAVPPEMPEPSPSPARLHGVVTFGVFQRLAKIVPGAWDAFADVLRRVPGSRLLLHNGDAELGRPESATARFVRAQLESRGIAPERLTLVGALNVPAHLDAIGQVDVALDTWPYSGHTTTCECLWMGVPVVTRSRSTHASRVSRGLLMRAGLGDWVTESREAYVDVACRLASDLEALAHTRATLRDRCIDAGLANGRQLAREMEQAYRQFCGV